MPLTPPKVSGPTALDPNSGVAAFASGLRNAPDSSLASISKGINSGLQTAQKIDSIFDISGKQEAAAQAAAQDRRLKELKIQNDIKKSQLDQQLKQSKLENENRITDARLGFSEAMNSGTDAEKLDSYIAMVSAGGIPASEAKAAGEALQMNVTSPQISSKISQVLRPVSQKAAVDEIDSFAKKLEASNDVYNSAALKGWDREKLFSMEITDNSSDTGVDLNATGASKTIRISQAGIDDIEIVSTNPNEIAAFSRLQQMTMERAEGFRRHDDGRVDPTINEAVVQANSAHVRDLLATKRSTDKQVEMVVRDPESSPKEIKEANAKRLQIDDEYQRTLAGFNNVSAKNIKEQEQSVINSVQQQMVKKYGGAAAKPVAGTEGTGLLSTEFETLAKKFGAKTVEKVTKSPSVINSYKEYSKRKGAVSYEAYVAAKIERIRNNRK